VEQKCFWPFVPQFSAEFSAPAEFSNGVTERPRFSGCSIFGMGDCKKLYGFSGINSWIFSFPNKGVF
jgi:hypothetical protein